MLAAFLEGCLYRSRLKFRAQEGLGLPLACGIADERPADVSRGIPELHQTAVPVAASRIWLSFGSFAPFTAGRPRRFASRGGEVHHQARLKIVENATHGRRVRNVGLKKTIALVAAGTRKRGRVGRICQLVDIEDVVVGFREQETNQRRAYEAPAPGTAIFFFAVMIKRPARAARGRQGKAPELSAAGSRDIAHRCSSRSALRMR